MKVALVTGASRGLGRRTAQELAALGHAVVVSARRLEGATDTVRQIEQHVPGAELLPVQLDVTDPASVQAARRATQERFGRLDVLVNNAAVILDDAERATLEQDPAEVLRTLDSNAVGALRVCQAFVPLMEEGGNVVNVSSGMGSLAQMGGGHPGYRTSKAALNALTRILHAELSGRGLRINAVCPGWVRTELGGPAATRSVEEGAAGIVWAATLGPDGPSGGFFRDGRPIDW